MSLLWAVIFAAAIFNTTALISKMTAFIVKAFVDKKANLDIGLHVVWISILWAIIIVFFFN